MTEVRARSASLINKKGGMLPNPFLNLENPAVDTASPGGGGPATPSFMKNNSFAALLDRGGPQSPILSAKRGRSSPEASEGSSPTLNGKNAKLAKVIDDSKNALEEGKYILGGNIDKMIQRAEEMKKLKSNIEGDKNLPGYLKAFLNMQMEYNSEAIEGFKTVSNAIESWGACMSQIESNFKDINQDMSARGEQVNHVRDKLRSVDEKESQKKVIEEIKKLT